MYCDICGRTTQSAYKKAVKKINIKGVDIPVKYDACLCTRCGEERYDHNQELMLYQKARETYQSKKRLVAASAVKAYMEKHSLSPAAMAELTTCTVNEIIAAREGKLLDQTPSNKIKRVMEVAS